MSRVLYVLSWINSDYTSWSTADVSRVREIQDWVDVYVCVSSDAVNNTSSAGLLHEMGYGLQLMRVPGIVRLSDGQEVIRCGLFRKRNALPGTQRCTQPAE